jgi:putative Mg2+ transporter-C (MgtC) family protein
MTLPITWQQIALRLLLTVVAGALVGINRTERGRAAGLRTNLLVCLAASVAMLQVNLLLGLAGRPANSFVMNDLMRLPLGILSGMGFIGAGAILRRDNMVVGVTTAATLWFVTVLGLCFGGGQIALGISALIIGLVVLWGFEWVEERMHQDRTATLIITAQANGPTEADIRALLRQAKLRISSLQVEYDNDERQRTLSFAVNWTATSADETSPAFLAALSAQPGVRNLQWKPMESRSH